MCPCVPLHGQNEDPQRFAVHLAQNAGRLGGGIRDGATSVRTPDGGTFTASIREFRKPGGPGMGTGPTSEQMVSLSAQEFRVPIHRLTPHRALSTHEVWIGEPGRQKRCRSWHVVNQVAAWHHETLFFNYEPADGRDADPAVVAILDAQITSCQFSRGMSSTAAENPAGILEPGQPRRWWQLRG